MKNEDVELRIANFTKEEAENYASISKLRFLLSILKEQLDPENLNIHDNNFYESFKLCSQAFDLSQKVFYTMQEGLYDPKES